MNKQEAQRLKPYPWAGAATLFPESTRTVGEALRLAGLNWRVRKEPVTEHRYQLIREDTNQVLEFVGSRYEPTQQTDAFAYADKIPHARFVAAGTSIRDALVWLLVGLPDTVDWDCDAIDEYLLLSVGHGEAGPVRCAHLGIRRSTQATVFTQIVTELGHSGDDATGDWFGAETVAGACHRRLLARVTALREHVPSESQVTGTLDKIFAKSPHTSGEGYTRYRTNFVRNLFLRGDPNRIAGDNYSAYALLCAIAEYSDFDRKVRVASGANPLATRLESNWFGYGAAFKTRATEIVEKLAGGNLDPVV